MCWGWKCHGLERNTRSQLYNWWDCREGKTKFKSAKHETRFFSVKLQAKNIFSNKTELSTFVRFVRHSTAEWLLFSALPPPPPSPCKTSAASHQTSTQNYCCHRKIRLPVVTRALISVGDECSALEATWPFHKSSWILQILHQKKKKKDIFSKEWGIGRSEIHFEC